MTRVCDIIVLNNIYKKLHSFIMDEIKISKERNPGKSYTCALMNSIFSFFRIKWDEYKYLRCFFCVFLNSILWLIWAKDEKITFVKQSNPETSFQ